MRDLPDDPIIACALRTGHAPWQLRDEYDDWYPHEPHDDDDEEDEDEWDD